MITDRPTLATPNGLNNLTPADPPVLEGPVRSKNIPEVES